MLHQQSIGVLTPRTNEGLRIGEMRVNGSEKGLDNGKQLSPPVGIYRMQLF